MTPTPRTDELLAFLPRTCDTQGDALIVQELVDLCRQLEREIAGARLPRKKALRDRAILRLLFDCGLRRVEVCRLDVHDFDVDQIWVRGKGLKRVTLPSVSGGGLHTGVTQDYVIDLEPGEYLYSCPLNPTPDYRLIVTGG